MAKKKGKKEASKASVVPVSGGNTPPATTPRISKRGWIVFAAGILVVFAGFVVLSAADPRGQNLASSVSPLLILAGYGLVAYGLVAKDPASSTLPPS